MCWPSASSGRSQSTEDLSFWALRDLSLDVEKGSILGVIGANGSGKSTLLRILARVTRPTRGRVEIFGQVGSLLEVGTGFHPELTGRENVYLNGAIIGMKRKEIDAKFDSIVAFSGVEEFLDTPVKRYSSGMQVRLAFSVAAYLEPEILLLDEVLAVGDAAFQKKSLERMHSVVKDGRTVLLVSHGMDSIKSLCSSTVLLDHGEMVFAGPTAEAIEYYLSLQGSR
jgi:homopolymeric O-antigen transport system ATP-binding protein